MCSDINLTNAVNRGKNHLSVVLILHGAKFSAPTCFFPDFVTRIREWLHGSPNAPEGQWCATQKWQRVQNRNSHPDFSTRPGILRNYSTRWLISKYSALGPLPAPLEMLQDLPPPSSATPERYGSSIGLVWMVPYGCLRYLSASQISLAFFFQVTALRPLVPFAVREET